MNIRNLYNNLETFYNMNFNKLINRRFYFDHNKLTWLNFLGKEEFDTYEEYHQWVIDEAQYSMMLLDGSALQIYYEFEDGELSKSSLSFLPAPELNYECFRFDLDYANQKDYHHSSYHVHFGYNTEELRFSLFHFPMPSEFIKFIFSLVYKDQRFYTYNKDNFFPDLDMLNDKYHHFIRLHLPF